jgi:hypothetical protein|tara:strand:- start:2226 stop:2756 length:531 start_codon:yes stop_codon:yes gene_type:complete
MKVYLVPQEYVRDIYPKIEEYIDRVVPTSNGRFDKIDLLHDIIVGKATLWTVVDEEEDNKIYGIIFTEITSYPRRKFLSITFASGDRLDEWMDESLKVLENWAVDNECESMEITGRKGWVKKLKPHDWEEEFVIIKKQNLKKNNLEVVKTEKDNGKESRKQSTPTVRVKGISESTA